MSIKPCMMKPLDNMKTNYSWVKLLTAISVATVLYSCNNTAATPGMAQQAMQLPVVSVTTTTATTFREYPASLEGKVNVEIRPQVEGYLEKIYVDEGAWVKAGQPLFRVDARVYNEALNTAKSSLLAAKANVAKGRRRPPHSAGRKQSDL
jgi:membrane fusion protein, multidrug efflux system